MNAATCRTPTTVGAETLISGGAPADAILLDVRSDAEFAGRRITGSYNFPLALLQIHGDELARRLSGPVVLICRTGVRAEQARLLLIGSGVADAVVLAGGVRAYSAAGGRTVYGRTWWDLDRQVRLVAGSLVLAGIIGGKYLSPWLRLLSGGIGAGLTASAATNTCVMGRALSRLPFNKEAPRITAIQAMDQLPFTGAPETRRTASTP